MTREYLESFIKNPALSDVIIIGMGNHKPKLSSFRDYHYYKWDKERYVYLFQGIIDSAKDKNRLAYKNNGIRYVYFPARNIAGVSMKDQVDIRIICPKLLSESKNNHHIRKASLFQHMMKRKKNIFYDAIMKHQRVTRYMSLSGEGD